MPESWKLEHPDQITLGEAVRSVRLVAMAGRVNLIGKDGPATLEVTKVCGPPLQVELSDSGELVIRHGDYSAKPQLFQLLLGAKRMQVDLSLALPPDALVNVNVVSGPVVVSNFHERVSVKGVSGEVTLAGVHGSARVATVSGAITAEQVTGDLSVKAVSGAITVIAGAGGAIDLAAVSGAIALDLEDPMPASVKLSCVSGAMTVRLPHDPDVRVELGTSNGRAVSSFPEVRASGLRGSQRLAGTVGSGQAVLTGKTVSGSVTLLRRSADEEPWDLLVEDERPVRDAVPGGRPVQDEVTRGQAPQGQVTQGQAPQDQASAEATAGPETAGGDLQDAVPDEYRTEGATEPGAPISTEPISSEPISTESTSTASTSTASASTEKHSTTAGGTDPDGTGENGENSEDAR